jgi:hypothetical protein
MQLIKRKRSNGSATVTILHKRSNNQKNVKFMNVYHVEKNAKINLKSTMTKAFKKAHPDWQILDVALREK